MPSTAESFSGCGVSACCPLPHAGGRGVSGAPQLYPEPKDLEWLRCVQRDQNTAATMSSGAKEKLSMDRAVFLLVRVRRVIRRKLADAKIRKDRPPTVPVR